MADVSEQEREVLQAVRDVKRSGYGTVTVVIHETSVTQILKTQSIKPRPEAA